MSTRPTHKLTPSMEDVHRILNIFTSSPTEHIQRPLQRTKSTTQLCISPSYRKSITTSSSTIKKCTSPATTPHMPTHLFHIPVWPRSSHQHPPKPRRFTFAQRHIAKHDDNLIEPSPASFHGSWGRQPSVELHLPITARAFACDEVDDNNMSTISLSPAALSSMSAAIEGLSNATTMLNVLSTITTTSTKPVEQLPKHVEPAKPLVQPPVATTTPTADTNTTPIAPARPPTPTTKTAAPIPVPIIPSPIIESDTPPLTPMKYITLPNSPPPSLPPNSPTPVIVHIPASPSSHSRVPPCTPINPIPLHHARTSHRLNRMSMKSSHDKSLPPFHSQSSTPLHYQSSHSSTYYQSHTPLHCLCASSPCSHIIDINTTHNYLYPSPTYSELSSFRSNIPSPNVSEHVTPTHRYTTPTPTHSRSSSRLIKTTPTHTRSSSRCNDTPTHAVYPSNWFNWHGRSMSMDACSPHHGTSVQSF